MPQVLKDEVQRRIAAAALAVFAEEGFPRATMAEIARRAGVSTGNLYRYHPSKEALFAEVLPEETARSLGRLVRRRVRALAGVRDALDLPDDAPFTVAARELVDFCVAHRHAVIVLLGRADGTPYERFAAGLIRSLERLAFAHFEGLAPGPRPPTEPTRVALRLAYQNLLRAMVDILGRWDDPARIRAAVDGYGRYHLAGLLGLLEDRPARRP